MSTIDRARAALARGAWREALAMLDDDTDRGTPDWLQLQGRACYGSGDLEGAVNSFERLHALHLAAGDESTRPTPVSRSPSTCSSTPG